MWQPLEQASSMAGPVDAVFAVLLGLSCIFAGLVAGLILFFAIRYRSGSNVDRRNAPDTNIPLELFWSIGPLILGLGVFVWAASLYFRGVQPPPNTLDIYVVAQQWMWKMQHPDGQREINALHVPVNRPVRLIMISQDVIHSFYVPAFRVKQDVLPGRYTSLWFEPTQTGTYPLRCAEYCGTEHSRMLGDVIVMEPARYQQWLENGTMSETTLGETGEALFANLGCDSCHQMDDSGRGPSLAGLAGSTVTLADGSNVTADEDYIRRSIVNPQAQIVAGYDPIMPSFKGQIDEDGLVTLIEYIKSI